MNNKEQLNIFNVNSNTETDIDVNALVCDGEFDGELLSFEINIKDFNQN